MASLRKKQARLKRAKKLRVRSKLRGTYRLVVIRSNQHMGAQIIKPAHKPGVSDQVVAAVHTCMSSFKQPKKHVTIPAAKQLGEAIALLALERGVDKVTFDRSGFKYHGRVKALADGAREKGLQF